MKKADKRKLAISSETIRRLDSASLRKVAGGEPPIDTWTNPIPKSQLSDCRCFTDTKDSLCLV